MSQPAQLLPRRLPPLLLKPSTLLASVDAAAGDSLHFYSMSPVSNPPARPITHCESLELRSAKSKTRKLLSPRRTLPLCNSHVIVHLYPRLLNLHVALYSWQVHQPRLKHKNNKLIRITTTTPATSTETTTSSTRILPTISTSTISISTPNRCRTPTYGSNSVVF
eukprot:GHVT01033524.1.p1 GENE.GHVT01033524.1~~GHVT01033524.1.p1  ORF type:complete len:165 (+),score=6.63 GHVT01033524.1:420-914(+)